MHITHKFPWLNKNNSSLIENIKNLSTKMNYTGLITPSDKISAAPNDR